jgi:DNA-binding MarR family transcriptional regulator
MPEQHYRAATYTARDSVGYLLRRVYSIMHERMEAALAGHDFTLMQWIVLLYLRDGLATTASDIAREFRHDSGALTRVIDQLQRRGLVSRRRSTSDRRVVDLTLTAEGGRTIEELLPVVVGQMNEALAPFTRVEFEQLRSLMERLVDHLHVLQDAEQPSPAAPELAHSRRRGQARKAGKRR